MANRNHMYKLYPYKLGSASSRRLAESLSAVRVRPDGRYRFRAGHRVINWGNSRVPDWMTEDALENIVNKPVNVGIASHKIRCFEKLEEEGVATVPFTTDREVAESWDGKVYVRQRLQGHSGEGISIVTEYDDLPDAPLYTSAVQNSGEYRVHVMNGEVIGYRKKSRQHEDEATEAESDVRTLENGWVYRTGELRRLERIEQLAISAIEALGLDFGAVDIIKNGDGEVFVLEVNTAVGLADNTLEEYVNGFNRHYNA